MQARRLSKACEFLRNSRRWEYFDTSHVNRTHLAHTRKNFYYFWARIYVTIWEIYTVSISWDICSIDCSICLTKVQLCRTESRNPMLSVQYFSTLIHKKWRTNKFTKVHLSIFCLSLARFWQYFLISRNFLKQETKTHTQFCTDYITKKNIWKQNLPFEKDPELLLLN